MSMRILVPIELTENHDALLKYSRGMSECLGAEVYLFHVAQLPDFYITELENYGSYEKELQKAFEYIHSKSLSRLNVVKSEYFGGASNVRCEAKLGKSIYYEILEYSEKLNPDFIIMGSAVNVKEGNMNIGSNAERLIRMSKVPVMFINEPVNNFNLRKIIFASDFHKDSVEYYRIIDKLFAGQNVSVRLLYINTKSGFEEYEDIKDRIDKFKKNFSGDFSVVIMAGKNIESSIVRYAKSIKPDLIVIGVKKRKGITKRIPDKIAEGVVGLSGFPVLAINLP